MRYYSIICLLMLLCSAFTAQGQQVNPFELRIASDSSTTIKDSSSDFTSNNSSIIVIEDSLQQPTILPETPVEVVPTEETAELFLPEVEEIIEEEVIPKQKNNNPFELIQTEEEKQEEEENKTIAPVELSTQDSSSSSSETDDPGDIPLVDINIDDAIVGGIVDKKNEVPLPKKGKNLLVFWASLFCGLLVAISLNSKKNILGEIWKSFRNLNYMKLLQKEQRNGWSSPYILLFIVFLINISIFIRFVAIEYKVPLFGYSLWKITIFIASLMTLRHLSLYILAYMRKRLMESLNYNFIIITVNIITGLLLVPINLFIAFSNESISSFAISSGIIIVSLSLVIRWFRAFINSLRIIIGDSFHFLLYLCSCEIVPIIIIVGYVRNLIN